MATTTTLYAWANPLSGFQGADHTWVTTYPDPFNCPPGPDYWYCWGDCHPTGPGTTARPLGSAGADLNMAKCICAPNDPNAHGGINLYGIEGVCHQLANRVLYATSPNGTPLTVNGAHLYWLSHFLFGTYGTTHADWAARKLRCGASTMAVMSGGGGEGGGDPDEQAFERMVVGEPELAAGTTSAARLQQVRATQADLLEKKRELDVAVQSGAITGEEFARQVNELVSSYLPRLSEILGPEDTERIFNAVPGQSVRVLDPEIAARTNYPGEKPEPKTEPEEV